MNIELVSIHVPKTAGTSFCRVLKNVYGEEAIFLDNGEYVGKELKDMPLQPYHRVIHGHVWAGRYKRRLPQARHVTWLRHPVDWLVSLHGFLDSLGPNENPVLQRSKREGSSLVDFAASEGVQAHTPSRFLMPVPLDEFFFVGLQEHFAEDLCDFCKMMGWSDVVPPTENRNLEPELLRLRSEVWSDHSLVKALCDRLEDDVKLYEAAVQQRARRLGVSVSA